MKMSQGREVPSNAQSKMSCPNLTGAPPMGRQAPLWTQQRQHLRQQYPLKLQTFLLTKIFNIKQALLWVLNFFYFHPMLPFTQPFRFKKALTICALLSSESMIYDLFSSKLLFMKVFLAPGPAACMGPSSSFLLFHF